MMGERILCPRCGSLNVKQSPVIAEVGRVYKEPYRDKPGTVE